MTKRQFSLEQNFPADWENTPETVKRWVESLIVNTQSLDAAPVGIALHDSAGQIICLNPLGCALLGIDRPPPVDVQQAELLQFYQAGTQQLYPMEALPSIRALAGETVQVDDVEIHRSDRIVSLEVWASPVRDDQGQVRYAIAVFQDISERKRLEAEAKQRELEQQIVENTMLRSESRYRQVIQSQTDLILRSLPDTTITFANDALCRALGRTTHDVIGMRWNSFVPPEDFAAIHHKIATLTPEAPTFENINQDYRANQRIGWTQWISLGIFDEQGQLVEIQSVGRDITELQQKILQEQALNRVFQSIRNSLDLNTIFATATAETAQHLQVNCRVAQYLPERGIWKHIAEFCQDADAPTAIGLEIPHEANAFSEQLQQLQVVCVDDTSVLEDEVNQSIAQRFPGAWLLIPLAIDGQLWGSFSLSTPCQPLVWREEQIQFAQGVADQLEVAIQQANLYQQVQLELEERCRIELALRESEARFQNMAANVPGALFRYLLRPDGSDGVLYMSPGCYGLWEVEAQDVVADASILWQMIYPEDLPAMYESVMESARTLQPWSHAWRIRTPSGCEKWLEATGRPIQYPNGDIIWDTLILDVSDRKHAETALRESEIRYRLLAENMNDLVCLHDLQGRYLYVSPSCETLLGYQYEEMLGQDPYTFFHPDDRDRVYQKSHAAAIHKKPVPITYRMRQKSGNYIWFETLTRPILDASGQTVVQLQTTSRDVTERVRVQHQLRHEALHDSLTGLPNRHLLLERLELAVNRAHRFEDYRFAVLFLDLDRFKVINDSLGHLAGDRLLIAIAQKLRATLRSLDLAARLGGDEFVVLLEEIKDVQEAVRATERIFAALQTPLSLEGRQVYTTVSVGIVLGTQNYTQAAHLLRDADIAMYRAKGKGKARYEIFDAEMHTQALKRLHLENDLRRAIERQEFVLHYQPIVALDSGKLVGFEALIRWQHPTQGLKFPVDFIAVAEETGLITQLDYWTLWTACYQLAAWQTNFPKYVNLKISVNLSAQDLRQANLLKEIDRVLQETGLSGHCLILEITESVLIEDIESTITLFSHLKERKIQISIDDFGTGYSSLNYLHRLPVDHLKVDRAFVNQIQTDQGNHQMVETIAALSHQLKLDAIAEGIESPQQLERLRALGYKMGQGYLFSKPLMPKPLTPVYSNCQMGQPP